MNHNFMNEEFDIIIQGGQSNAEGMGGGEVLKAYTPLSDVLYLEAEKEVVFGENEMTIRYKDVPFLIRTAEERFVKDPVHGDSTLGDFSLAFAEQYIQSGLLKNGRKLLIIRGAIGGTGFKKGHWGLKDKVYLKMLEMVDYALALNPKNRVIAFLWHQGEHDAFERNNPEQYKQQLSDMVKDVRIRYGNMPFIAGDFVNEWKIKNLSICEPIIACMKLVIEALDNAGFVETSDLLSNNQKTGNGDDIHFCRESLYILGDRYFRVYKTIIEA